MKKEYLCFVFTVFIKIPGCKFALSNRSADKHVQAVKILEVFFLVAISIYFIVLCNEEHTGTIGC